MESSPQNQTHFDAESAIADFRRDSMQLTLELPPMSTAQRKYVKAIVDRYSELYCESFGLSLERCIHIFKRDTDSRSVSVKNTFIDDWITPTKDDDELEEPVSARSLPSQLPDARWRMQDLPSEVSAYTRKLDLSPINEGSPKLPSDSFGLGCGKNIDPTNLPPLPLSDHFQVRNTFIHVDSASADQRSVQTEPKDFRQCLQEEVRAQNASAHFECLNLQGLHRDQKQTQCEVSKEKMEREGEVKVLTPGEQVVIQGLTKIPAFNGQSGIVERLDEKTGRYSVRLTTGGPGIPKFALVKADNLSLAPHLPSLLSATSPYNPLQKNSQAYFGAFGDKGEVNSRVSATTPLKLTALI